MYSPLAFHDQRAEAIAELIRCGGAPSTGATADRASGDFEGTRRGLPGSGQKTRLYGLFGHVPPGTKLPGFRRALSFFADVSRLCCPLWVLCRIYSATCVGIIA
jgi:hypothetical protein